MSDSKPYGDKAGAKPGDRSGRRAWTPRAAPRRSARSPTASSIPVLAKRAGISTELIGVWDEIAGESFADCTRPEKIAWPRRHFRRRAGGRL